MDTNDKMWALIITLSFITAWVILLRGAANDVCDWIDDWVRMVVKPDDEDPD